MLNEEVAKFRWQGHGSVWFVVVWVGCLVGWLVGWLVVCLFVCLFVKKVFCCPTDNNSRKPQSVQVLDCLLHPTQRFGLEFTWSEFPTWICFGCHFLNFPTTAKDTERSGLHGLQGKVHYPRFCLVGTFEIFAVWLCGQDTQSSHSSSCDGKQKKTELIWLEVNQHQ